MMKIFKKYSNKKFTGKVEKTSGSIKISGHECSITKYRNLVGFVPQDDVMHRTLTVKENLFFSADTRLPSDTSSAVRSQVVNTVIKLLGLNRVRHSIIGNEEQRGVSGGERKRVNIGMELVAKPLVLFLDEVNIVFSHQIILQIFLYSKNYFNQFKIF